jgi:hydroxyacylglutathione hydrolase
MKYIDVRTREEFDAGHVEGAIHHDIMDIMQGALPNIGKDEEAVLYCESGNRSMMAKAMLQNAGFTHLIDGGSMDDVLKSLNK